MAFVLDGEVDQCRRAAEGRGACAGFKIIGAGGAAEGHVEMRVYIDAAWKNELVAGIENSRSGLSRA